MSLVEVMTSVAMLLVVLVTFMTVLETLNRGMQTQQERSIANDQARLAIERLDREIRSGNVLYNPAAETLANYSFRVYTQANATTRTPPFMCVQWQITTGNELQRRDWPPGEPENVSSWDVVATEVVNRTVTPAVPAFALDPDPVKAGRTLDVTFVVDVDTADASQKTVRIQTSLTGRNTSYGYSADVCEPVPA
jgi:hypothetical protein